jgi:hypothetical protein
MKQLITLLILVGPMKVFGLNYQTDTIDFQSDILNETKKVYVYKPDKLSKTDSVGFIYLLDGSIQIFGTEKYKTIILIKR